MQVQIYPHLISLNFFVHGSRKDFSEKNNLSFLKHWINHFNYLVLPIATSTWQCIGCFYRNQKCKQLYQFLQPFFIFICYPETNSLGSPKYMLLKMTASHLKEIAIECFQGNKCSAFAPINFFNCALTAWAYFFINSSMEK